MKRYDGKRVYITGGSSGIGKAMATLLVAHGADVVISARGRKRLEQAKTELEVLRVRDDQIIGAVPVDVSNREEVETAAPAITQMLGGLDILVNNAGVAYVDRIEKATPDEYERMMQINYFGMVWTTLAFLPHFREQRTGTIAAVSSTLGIMGVFGYTAYAASKHAVAGFIDCLRQDMLEFGVQVSILFPSDTDTPQFHEENRTKPAETKALAGWATLSTADYVAARFLRSMASGKYTIAPGFANKFVIWAHHKLPWLSRRVIDHDLRKFWRNKPTLAQSEA